MFTINEYIDSLKQDKANLVENLTVKGITCSNTETFTTLVPKVLDITSVNNQSKSTTITTNGTTTITPDTGYTGLSSVEVTTNVEADVSEYFKSTISGDPLYKSGILASIKKIPDNLTVVGNTLNNAFSYTAITDAPTLDTTGVLLFYDMFNSCTSLVNVPIYNMSSATNVQRMFQKCTSLETLPSLNLSNVGSFLNFADECTSLKNVPLYNCPNATSFSDTFRLCSQLTDTSLDNILQMCISTTNKYYDTKTLYKMGFRSSDYSVSRIQALPHYQDFIDAGWTIGY